ncbi:MAG: hypothetical protein AAB898_01945, partial [Patescibacteria group bacterium]
LLIIAAVLAYLSWDNGLKLARENVQLLSAATQLQDQNNDLRAQMDASVPIPFFYSQWLPESIHSRIHRIDPITKVDTIIATIPGRHLDVFAQPRVGYNGTIWLSEFPLGDHDFASIQFHSFQVDGDGDATPVPFQANLPPNPTALALSPDETRIAAIYSDRQNPYADNAVVVWDFATGQATRVDTLPDGSSFAPTYTPDLLMADGYRLWWSSNDCVMSPTYRIQEDQSRLYTSTPVFCAP